MIVLRCDGRRIETLCLTEQVKLWRRIAEGWDRWDKAGRHGHPSFNSVPVDEFIKRPVDPLAAEPIFDFAEA